MHFNNATSTDTASANGGRNPLDAWERGDGKRRVSAFFAVFGAVLFKPHAALAPNSDSAGVGGALQFWLIAALCSLTLGAAVNALLSPLTGGLFAPAGWGDALFTVAAGYLCSTAFVAAFAGYHHLFAALVGAAQNRLRATFRMFAYVNGSLALIAWTPCLGAPLYFFWGFYLCVAGLQAAHGASALRSFLAVSLAWGLPLMALALALFAFGVGLMQLLNAAPPPMKV